MHGTAPRLVCLYHQWTYQLDGRLIAARDMGSRFDKSQHGSKPVHCTSVGGYIWICVALVAPDFEPIRKHIEPYFLPHHMHDTKVAFESTIIEHANWKLVWENNRECYHCAVNHPELVAAFREDPAITGVEGAAANPRITSKWAHWESIGLPSKFHIAASGQYRTARMPLVEGTVSFTMAGNAAVRRPLSPSIQGTGRRHVHHVQLPQHLESHHGRPCGAHSACCRSVHRDPIDHEVVGGTRTRSEGVDYDVKALTEVWLATNEADRRICQGKPEGRDVAGLRSGAVFAGARERRDAIHRLVRLASRGAADRRPKVSAESRPLAA